MYPGQHMSIEDNIFYAKRNIVDSIWKEANIEKIANMEPGRERALKMWLC